MNREVGLSTIENTAAAAESVETALVPETPQGSTDASYSVMLPLIVVGNTNRSAPSATPNGGQVSSSDGRVTLTVPAGAVSEDVWITLAMDVSPPPVDDSRSLGVFFRLTAQTASGQAVAQFSKPLVLDVRYAPKAAQAGVQAGVYFFDERLAVWQALPTTELVSGNLRATTDHFTNFAVLTGTSEVSYEVGVGPADDLTLGQRITSAITDAFRAAYARNNTSDKPIGKPFGPVHVWNDALIQDFNWASIIYNPNTGSAYYLQGEYISTYVDIGGPGSFLKLPLGDQVSPPADALLLDKHTNFTGNPIQRFEGGFIGKDTNASNGEGFKGVHYYPLLKGATVKVEHMEVQNPAFPDDPKEKITRAKVTMQAGETESNPPQNDKGLEGIWVESSSDSFDGWLPDQGTGARVWENLEPTGELKFRLEAWAKTDLAGYLPCDSFKKQEAGQEHLVSVPLTTVKTYTWSYTCSGFGGGGSVDSEPPVIGEPEVWQNGKGYAIVSVSVTDNVGVRWVKLTLNNGQPVLMTLWKGSTYAAVISLKQGKNSYVLDSADLSGLTAHAPKTGTFEIWSTLNGLFGQRPAMGYSDDPVNTGIGNFIYSYTDLTIPALGPDVELDRWYNDQSRYTGQLGTGWTWPYDFRLTPVDNMLFQGVQARYPDGHTANFTGDGGGAFTRPDGTYDTLRREGSGYALTTREQVTYYFDDTGRLLRVADLDGHAITLAYNGDDLASITDGSGRTLTVTTSSGRVTALAIPGYGTITYQYAGDRLNQVIDTEGDKTVYTYDSEQRIIAIASPNGNPFLAKQTFDEQGRVLFQRGGEAFVNTFSYDDDARTTVLKDAFGFATTHVYDDRYRLVKVIDPLGHATTYTYNDDDEHLTVTDRNGHTTTYTYDDRGNVLTATDPLGNTTSYTYDASNRKLTSTDALGHVTSYTYDAEGHLTKVVDALGGVTIHTYNEQGQRTRTIDPLGNMTETTFNAQDLPVSVRNALGHTLTTTYDDAGHIKTQTDAAGNITSYRYNAQGQLQAVTDPLGYETRYTYDGDNHVVAETDADGNTRTFSYDVNGRLVAQSDWAGNITNFAYDAMGRKLTETDPLRHSLTYTYDAVGRIATMTDRRGAKTTYTYDPEGNLLSERNALGHETTYSYDALNRRVEVRYPCSCIARVERTRYDAMSQVVETTDALGNRTIYTYDALGREVSQVDALGNKTQKVYDLVGRLPEEIDALGNSTRYSYNALGQEVARTDRLGHVWTKTYDALGRVVKETDARGGVTRYIYDKANRLLQVTDALGGGTTYTYDGRGNQLTITDALGHTTTNVYDANSNLVQTTNPRGFTTTFSHDALEQQVKAVDALQGVTTSEYDPTGALLKETDAAGYVREYAYDVLGRQVIAVDRNGNKTTYAYDPAGNQVTLTDPLGGTTTSTFDANNNQVSRTDALGFTTLYRYDALNRQVSITNPIGGITSQVYDALGRVRKMVDANGNATSNAYDVEGRLITTTDALGGVTRFSYDANGNRETVTDRNGHRTTFSYDALNRQISRTDALGNTEREQYDAVGNRLERINMRGFTTRFTYDANRNLTATTDALGGVIAQVFDALDRPVALTDANGHTTQYAYDAVGNRTAVTLPEGQVSRYTYDGERNHVSFTNAKGFLTQYTYDAMGRQVRETDPLGHVTRTAYDAVGHKVATTDAQTNTTVFVYDALGRLVAVTDALGFTTSYTYDPVGNKLAETNANGYATSFRYDALNRLVEERNPLGHTWAWTYDPEGNPVAQVDANGQRIGYVFDAINQQVGTRYPDGRRNVTLVYDPNGNLVETRDAIGTTTMKYDPLDREISKQDPYRRVLVSGYDPVGNRLTVTYPSGDVVTYAYNKNNWMVSMTDPSNGVTGYSHDLDGLPIRTSYANHTWTEMVYDRAGRLVKQVNGTSSPTGIITAYAYILDAVGNRLQTVEQFTQGQIQTITKDYQYDHRYQLLRAIETYAIKPVVVITTEYTYDPVGNRLTITTNRDVGPGTKRMPDTISSTYDAANRLLSSTGSAYTYDANGNRLTRQTVGAPITQSRLERYTYDGENRLVEYTRTRTQSGQVEQRVFNGFDGLGRRLIKGTQESAGVVKWTQYAVDGLGYDQLSEYPQWGPPRITQLYRGEDQALVAMDEIQGSGAGSQYWFARDGLGSVTATTKQQGQSAHTYFYTPSGELIDENGHWEDSSSWTDPHNHYLLTGKEWDEESRVYYSGARFYDAAAGVWLTQDPYRGELSNPITLHRFLYVHNNPVNLVDPLGFFAWDTGHVEWGDTLWQISQDSGVSMSDIRRWNPKIKYPDVIYAGMYLWLPASARNAGELAEAHRRETKGDERWGKHPPVKPEPSAYGNEITKDFIQQLKNSANEMRNFSDLRDSAFNAPDGMIKDKLKEKFSEDNVSRLPQNVINDLRDTPYRFNHFYSKVRSRADWDYKSNIYLKYRNSGVYIAGKLYDNDIPGNVGFGYAGVAADFLPDTLKMLAGLAQKAAGTSSDAWTWEMSYFDDPKDQKAIEAGMSLYKAYGTNIDANKLDGRIASLVRSH